jgi:hypothetical protein
MNELGKVIFGNLPLLGISYKGEQKDEEYRRRFSHKDEMKKVMRIALHYGIRYFAASAHDFNERAPVYLDAIKEVETENEVEITLITCIARARANSIIIYSLFHDLFFFRYDYMANSD